MRSPTDHYVSEHPRSAQLWYQRDVPKDVRGTIGKTRWKQTLGTAVRADAIRKARSLAQEHDRLIDEARATNVDPLARLTDDERAAIEQAGGIQGYIAYLGSQALDADDFKFKAEHVRTGAVGLPADLAVQATARAALLDARSVEIQHEVEQAIGTLDRLGVDREQHGLVAALPGQVLTLSGVLEKWMSAKQPSAPEQYGYVVRLFEELHGALPLNEITEEHVRDFRDVLRKVPKSAGRHGGKLAKLDVRSMLALAEQDGLPRLGESTASKYFRGVKTILKFAKSDGHLRGQNPAAGLDWHPLKQKFSEKRKKKRRTLSATELGKLLDCAANVDWQTKDDNLWFLRLLIWTGARPEEIAQLAPQDVRPIGDTLCLHIHDAGDNRVKNASSLRIVPVHPGLLALGFEAFVAAGKGQVRLFASLEPDGRGRLYSRMGDRLTRLIDDVAKITDPRVVVYSIRHSFKDALRLARPPEEIGERIMGHRSPGRNVARGYGNPDQVRELAEWMAKVDPLDPARQVREFEDGAE